MSDAPIERDKSGRFVKPEVDVRPPDLEQEYHPLALSIFGWTRSGRLPVIALLICAGALVAFVALSAGSRSVAAGLSNVSGFYALSGFLGAVVIAIVGVVLVRLFGRDADYYGEADTQPDDVEEQT
ncbi:MAG: hypothetical protein AAGJ85_02005 [Pseudomonadota bacterium]